MSVCFSLKELLCSVSESPSQVVRAFLRFWPPHERAGYGYASIQLVLPFEYDHEGISLAFSCVPGDSC